MSDNTQNAQLQPGTRMLPQNIEAEESVLAACLNDADVMVEVATKLEPANFYRQRNGIIFDAMCNLNNRGIPVDPISVVENLHGTGNLAAAGGKDYLIELSGRTAALSNWRAHTEVVRRTSILRELAFASAQINSLAYDAPDDLGEIVEESEKILFNVTEKRVSSEFKPVKTLVTQAYDEIVKLAQQKDSMAGVPTGFIDVDNLFHGFRGGDLIILAARPGVGKTAFALNLAVNAAKAGTTVAFLSLEMSASQLIQRVICSEANLSLSKLRAGKIAESDWGAIADASDTISKLDMFIDDTPSLSILELRAKARRELRGKDNGLIIVDYLQLMQPAKARRDGNRAVEVGEISRGLKVLAKEMNMPVLALSQLSRSVEMRGKKRPMLSDLRESGSIEQDADIVMFIDRSINDLEAEEEGRPDKGMAELIVAKHRNGPTRDISLTFSAENTRFGNFFDDSQMGGI